MSLASGHQKESLSLSFGRTEEAQLLAPLVVAAGEERLLAPFVAAGGIVAAGSGGTELAAAGSLG
jgi:hypothetical protein